MSCNFLDFGQASARILITNADNGPTVSLNFKVVGLMIRVTYL